MNCVVLGVVVAFSIGNYQASDFTDPASLASELRALQIGKKPLPVAWNVRTPDGDYSISTAPLRERLAHSPADAQAWLAHLAEQLEAYSTDAPDVHARSSLERILARPEFAGNGPPTGWDRFRERISTWIEYWLRSLFKFAGGHPIGFYVVFWIAILAAVGLMGFFLFRLWNSDTPGLGLSGVHQPISLRTWQKWLHAASEASNEGDLRRAIQCAYWAGIARLQESRVLPLDLAHTPREYLRLLSANQQIKPMRMLTSQLERFWYARATPTVEDFSACLGYLEALGCKVD